MSEKERSLIVYDYWIRGQEKFDYLIVGVTGAMAAYLTQTLKVDPIAWAPNTVELAALFALLLSTYCGVKRIAACVTVTRLNHESLKHRELYADKKTAGVAHAELQKHADSANSADEEASRVGKWTNYWSQARSATLIAGVLMIIAARIWAAYYPKLSESLAQ